MDRQIKDNAAAREIIARVYQSPNAVTVEPDQREDLIEGVRQLFDAMMEAPPDAVVRADISVHHAEDAIAFSVSGVIKKGHN